MFQRRHNISCTSSSLNVESDSSVYYPMGAMRSTISFLFRMFYLLRLVQVFYCLYWRTKKCLIKALITIRDTNRAYLIVTASGFLGCQRLLPLKVCCSRRVRKSESETGRRSTKARALFSRRTSVNSAFIATSCVSKLATLGTKI